MKLGNHVPTAYYYHDLVDWRLQVGAIVGIYYKIMGTVFNATKLWKHCETR